MSATTPQPGAGLFDDDRNAPRTDDRLRYSVSLVTQGGHRFYTLTMPSHVLARTCFVTNRFDDPLTGFQRRLDRKRAQQIADYIDKEHGTIPNSIVLSAQADADARVIGRGKTLDQRHSWFWTVSIASMAFF